MDAEARVQGTSMAVHPQELRLWLRLLTCTQLIEQTIRSNLRSQFATTLPRFDLMAQLERTPGGLMMNELSRRMMVTRGNITGITDQLVSEGLVERVDVPADKRSWRVRLTKKGRSAFNGLALEHERWIVDAFAGLGKNDVTELHALLGRVKENLPKLRADARADAKAVANDKAKSPLRPIQVMPALPNARAAASMIPSCNTTP